MESRVETAWIMAEIKPYSFESMRNSSESEEDNMFTRVKMSTEEEINRSVYFICFVFLLWRELHAQMAAKCLVAI